jgi:Protein of unknown function (DUF2950)
MTRFPTFAWRLVCTVAICGAAAAQTPKTFPTAQAASDALIAAAQTGDPAQVMAIFGARSRNVFMSGDADRDKREMMEFAQLAQNKHHLEADAMNHERMMLFVGTEDWPFPVPIVRTNGSWKFDSEQGVVEMRSRRIGGNELDAIEICAGYVEAQRKYAAQDHDKNGMHEYAKRVMSSPGKEDGLFWTGAGAPLVPRGFAEASATANPKPYHGYYFRVLTSQGPDAPGGAHSYLVKDSMIGGFGLVAWPTEYGVTGVYTFIVNQSGVVYERDSGKPASNMTPPVTVFNPDKSWNPSE